MFASVHLHLVKVSRRLARDSKITTESKLQTKIELTYRNHRLQISSVDYRRNESIKIDIEAEINIVSHLFYGN